MILIFVALKYPNIHYPNIQMTKDQVMEIDYNVQPPHLYPEYKSTILRSPTKPLVPVAEMLKDISLPAFGESAIGKFDNDLTENARKDHDPIGERIKVFGKVMDHILSF